jgi:hypothetical protein
MKKEVLQFKPKAHSLYFNYQAIVFLRMSKKRKFMFHMNMYVWIAIGILAALAIVYFMRCNCK